MFQDPCQASCSISKHCYHQSGQYPRSQRGCALIFYIFGLMLAQVVSQPLRSEMPPTVDGIPLSCNLYNDADYHFNHMHSKGSFPPREYQYRPMQAAASDGATSYNGSKTTGTLLSFEDECLYLKVRLGSDTGGYSLIKVCLAGFSINFKTMAEYSRDAAKVQNLLTQSWGVDVQQYLRPFTEVTSVVAMQKPDVAQVITSHKYVVWVEPDHRYTDRYRISLYNMFEAHLLPVKLPEESSDTSFVLPSVCGQWMAYQLYNHQTHVWSIWLYDIEAQYADVIVSSYDKHQHFHPMLMDAELDDPHIKSSKTCSPGNLRSGCPELECRLIWISSYSDQRPSTQQAAGKVLDHPGRESSAVPQRIDIHRVDLPMKTWHSPIRLDVQATQLGITPNQSGPAVDSQGAAPYPFTPDGDFTVLLDMKGSGDLLFLLVGKPAPNGTTLSAYKILRCDIVDSVTQDLPGSESTYPLELLACDEHGLLYWQLRGYEQVVLMYKIVHLNKPVTEVATFCTVVHAANVTGAVLYKDVVVWEEYEPGMDSSRLKLLDLNKDNDFLFDLVDYFPFVGEYTLDSDNDGIGDESDVWTARGACVHSNTRGACTGDLVYMYALWAVYVVTTSAIAAALLRKFYVLQHAKAAPARAMDRTTPGLPAYMDVDTEYDERLHSQTGLCDVSRASSIDMYPGRHNSMDLSLHQSKQQQQRPVAESDEMMFSNALYDSHRPTNSSMKSLRSFPSRSATSHFTASSSRLDSAPDERVLKRGFAVINAMKIAQHSFNSTGLLIAPDTNLTPMLASLEFLNETALVMLTIVSLVMAVVPFWSLNPLPLKVGVLLTWIDFYITHFFVLDLIARYVLRDPVHVPGCWEYLKRNWMDLTALATDIPGLSSVGALRFLILSRLRHLFKMFRLIRVLKVFRFMRMYRTLVKHSWLVHLMLSKPALFVSILVLMIALACAAAIKIFEQGVQPHFSNFAVPLWLTVVTMTTTGYGDYAAQTIPGRVVCSFLMMIGIGGLGVVTATLMRKAMKGGSRQQILALMKAQKVLEVETLKLAAARLSLMFQPMLAVYDCEQKRAFFASDEQVRATNHVHKSTFMNRNGAMEVESSLAVEIRMRQDIQPGGGEGDPMAAIAEYEHSVRERTDAEREAVLRVLACVQAPNNVTLPEHKLMFVLHRFKMGDGKEAIKDFDKLYMDLCAVMFEQPWTSSDLFLAKAMALNEAMCEDGSLPEGAVADLQDPLGQRLVEVEEVLINHNVHYRSDYFEILLELVVLMTMQDRMNNCMWAVQNAVHQEAAERSPRPYRLERGRGTVRESMYHLVPNFDFVYSYLDTVSPEEFSSLTSPTQLDRALQSVTQSTKYKPTSFKRIVRHLQGVAVLNAAATKSTMHSRILAATAVTSKHLDQSPSASSI